MNTSLDNLTHKMQRAALGKIVDVALSRAEQDREKTMCQLVDAAKQFYGSGFSDETYENAKTDNLFALCDILHIRPADLLRADS